MHRGRTYRLYPTAEQADRLGQWVGTVRFVYNLALEQRRIFGRRGRQFNFVNQGRELTDLRKEADWLADVPRNALDAALRDLDEAYAAWRVGRARAPSRRQRGINDSFRLKSADFRRLTARAGALTLPKIGDVRARWESPPVGEPRRVTVFRRADFWYVSIIYRDEREAAEASNLPAIGIDRGVTVFAACSDGHLIEGPNVGRRAAARLARTQQQLARKAKGSANRRKARLRVSRLQKRVSDARKDFLHKVSTNLAKNHGVVVLEDLKIGNMTRARVGLGRAAKAGLNRAILDQGWGTFKRMLAYKLEERGGHLLTVDPRNTSRTCSACGVVDGDSREGVRFSCRSCGHQAHADTNAAINILRRGTACQPAETAIAVDETGTSQGVLASPQGWMPVALLKDEIRARSNNQSNPEPLKDPGQ